MSREYPAAASQSFPTPPRHDVDEDGREIEITAWEEADREALIEMYVDFDPGDRAQGIPPVKESAIRDWLDAVLGPESIALVARHGDVVVGNAMLVPEDDGEEYELAIFVTHDYQGAGIGTALLRTLLGQAQAAGVEYVWLTVERWNDPAIALYRKVGFEATGSDQFDMEMAIQL